MSTSDPTTAVAYWAAQARAAIRAAREAAASEVSNEDEEAGDE